MVAWGETFVFARTSCLFGISGDHTLPPGGHLFGCACSDSAVLQTYLSEWSSQHGALPEMLPPKQPFWDRPRVVLDKAVIKNLISPSRLASFLAASSPHSGDWLFALPIASCGLKLDDEAVRIGVWC